MSSSRSPHEYHDDQSTLATRNKRRNTALSCAECRRLKLRCSRNFPCSNCVKKGCAAICPDGSLTTGKGNRFVLANTEVLHEKIGELSNRVRQLEDALAQAHSSLSNNPHPLLSEDLLLIKRPLEREKPDVPAQPLPDKEPEDATDAIGSLSISESGRASFFGQTANSWYLLQNEDHGDEDEEPDNTGFSSPSDVPWLSHAFPFTSVSKSAEQVRGLVIGSLPRGSVAQRMSSIYYRHAGWMYTPIPEAEFAERVLRRIYDPDAAPYQDAVDSHILAVLYIVLALGVLLDLERPAHSPEAMQYYQLSRAALSLDSVLEEQSITAIQALLLMCHFMFLSDIEGPRWVLMGVVVKLAHSVGLHRDSGKWQLGLEDTRKRRALMWEIYTYDSWQSLTYGRPPSFSLAHIDSQMAHETTKNATGEVEMSFAAWKHRFSSQCLDIVHDKAFGARSPNYKTVQDLDKRVREFYVPPSLQVPGFGASKASAEVEQPSIQLTMQRYIAFAIREITLFYMHRGFFARAIEENPDDPLGSKYAPSVLAAYSTACSFVGLIESLFSQHPALTERMWFLFTHVFSCAIVLGAIATKSRMALAPSALSHLESAYSLFQQVSENPRAAKVLPILKKLKDRAHATVAETKAGTPPDATARPSFFDRRIKNEVDEFSALGGMTRFVSRRTSSSPSSPLSSGRGNSHPASLSPRSHQAQPVTVRTPPPPPQGSSSPPVPENPLGWQDYSHVQHFNDYPSYNIIPEHLSSDYAGGQPYSNVPMSAEAAPEYYPGYYDASMRGGYVQQVQGMQGTLDSMTAPVVPDLSASWHSFMAQFKSP